MPSQGFPVQGTLWEGIIIRQLSTGSIRWGRQCVISVVIPSQRARWRGNPPVGWNWGTISAHALLVNRRDFWCEAVRDTFHPGDSHANDMAFRQSQAARLPPQPVKKASQSLPPAGSKGILIIFCRGVYLTENTTQAAILLSKKGKALF